MLPIQDTKRGNVGLRGTTNQPRPSIAPNATWARWVVSRLFVRISIECVQLRRRKRALRALRSLQLAAPSGAGRVCNGFGAPTVSADVSDPSITRGLQRPGPAIRSSRTVMSGKWELGRFPAPATTASLIVALGRRRTQEHVETGSFQATTEPSRDPGSPGFRREAFLLTEAVVVHGAKLNSVQSPDKLPSPLLG